MKPPQIKNILVVAESIDVEDSSGTKGRVALIKNLKKAGFEVVVYHYTRRDIQLEGIPCVAIKEDRKSILFFLSRFERFLRYKFKLFLHKPLEKTFGFSFTVFNDRNSIVAALKNVDMEPDLVLTLSKGGSFRPHHALLKIPEWHSKWMAYMHDPYPMHHYPKPYTWTEPGAPKKEAFIRDISEKAAFSAFPSQLLKEWMVQFYSSFLRTGVIIPHQLVEKEMVDVNFPVYFNPREFNILHAGNLLGARNPKILVNAFKKFLRLNPRAMKSSRLLFLGGNNQRLEKESKSENIFVSNEYVSFDLVYHMQQHTAVNIILEAKSDISPFLPGKFPHCISSNKPILLLGPRKSEARRLLGEEYPWWSEIDDEERIINLLSQLFLKWEEISGNFNVDYSEIKYYLSEEHLKNVIQTLGSQ
ncbi:hypothetical protein DET49_10775 [Salegentibacter sp. 24]|uniref:UDP-glycosyltransferase n=1 Tax=Salegentibacter sp. 24 TaxID=2183986 RepID=UPI0010E6B263|nr:UDP-glycosyltransferase [Salegentibacter sp. 24]TDN89159.1 hypothetical protein DET49_10775 [Salegentibacter sp. 24]